MKPITGKIATATAGLIAALLGSTCCIAPLLAFAGLIGVTGAQLQTLIHLKPYLLGFGVALIAFALFRSYRPKGEAAENQCGCRTPFSSKRQRLFLWGAAVSTIVTIAWPHVWAGISAKVAHTAIGEEPAWSSVRFTIEGLDQECCVGIIEFSLKEIAGYQRSRADLTTRTLEVWFDSSRTNENSLRGAINQTDYKVKNH